MEIMRSSSLAGAGSTAAPVGYLSFTGTSTSPRHRTLRPAATSYVPAGAVIVADSAPDAEFRRVGLEGAGVERRWPFRGPRVRNAAPHRQLDSFTYNLRAVPRRARRRRCVVFRNDQITVTRSANRRRAHRHLARALHSQQRAGISARGHREAGRRSPSAGRASGTPVRSARLAACKVVRAPTVMHGKTLQESVHDERASSALPP